MHYHSIIRLAIQCFVDVLGGGWGVVERSYRNLQVINGNKYFVTKCAVTPDVCLSQPCMNGGTCKEIVGSFYCQCDTAYSGDDCSMGELCSIYQNKFQMHLCFGKINSFVSTATRFATSENVIKFSHHLGKK